MVPKLASSYIAFTVTASLIYMLAVLGAFAAEVVGDDN